MVTTILVTGFVAAGTVAIYHLLKDHMSNFVGGDHRSTAASTGLALLASCIGVALAGPRSFDLLEPGLAFLGGMSKRAKILFACCALLTLLLVAKFALDAFPNSGDEYAYLLQAQSYAQGRLWVDPPPFADAFALERFQVKNGMWLSQYPPGWALILTPAVLLGIPPWIVNPILGVGLLFAFWALAREQMGKEAAAAAIIGLAGSAFFVLNAASYFSHIACTLWAVLFSLFAVRYLRSGNSLYAWYAGAFLGLLGITRPFNAAIFILPFVVTLAALPRHRAGLLPFFIGGAPFAAALLAFNQVITGDPFTMVQSWVNHGHEPLGIPTARSIYFRLTDLIRLNAFTSPLLVLGFVPSFVWLMRRHKLAFTDWIVPITALAFAFYGGDGGDQYGPRYFFEAFPFAILTIAKALDGTLFANRTIRQTPILASALLMHFAVQLGYLGPALAREHQVVVEREDAYRKVADARLTNAIVLFATSGTGKIRRMPPQDLVRNGLRIDDQPVIYAHDLGARNTQIRDMFPNRTFYLYKGGELALLR